MNINFFHFAEPLWLLGLILIPIVFFIFSYCYQTSSSKKNLNNLIDSHLIPYLLIDEKKSQKLTWKTKILTWSLIWAGLMFSLAGPRFDFREIETMSKDQNLIILLDLSESMNAKDVVPSRLTRGLQKIEDLISNSNGIKIGMIAFAADSHLITPLTEDKEAIRHLLPSIGTDIVYVQGSRLTPALKMAEKMIEMDGNHHHDFVLISDGGFDDKNYLSEVKKLGNRGISIHVIGVGTVQGAVLQDVKGNTIKKNGKAIISKLERQSLQEISKNGQGYYIEQGFTRFDESVILDKLQEKLDVINAGKKMRLWNESFYIFLIPILPLFLYKFRKQTSLTVLIFLFLQTFSLQAEGFKDHFMSLEQIGEEKFQAENFKGAAEIFQDPYKKGVALYRAGDYAEAEKFFKESLQNDVSQNSSYNLGNALARQQKFQEAIEAYEEVLKKDSDHIKAKENLELVKQMMQQKSNEQSKDQNQKKSESKDDKEDKNDSDKSSESNSSQDNPSSNSKQPNSQQDTPEEKSENDKTEEDSQNNLEKDSSNDEQNEPHEDELKDPHEDPKEDQKNIAEADLDEKSQKDQDADMWLNRLNNKPKDFLKNKFYIESKKNGTREGIDPW